jgi:hypothetical protein
MLSGLDQTGREAAWEEIESSLQQFERGRGFEGPSEMIAAIGTK